MCVMIRSKIVENLAVVNYDTNNLHLAPYDWRLSYGNLEVRDGYFSKLKATIEGFKYVSNPVSVFFLIDPTGNGTIRELSSSLIPWAVRYAFTAFICS